HQSFSSSPKIEIHPTRADASIIWRGALPKESWPIIRIFLTPRCAASPMALGDGRAESICVMALFPEIQFSAADHGSGGVLCDETLMKKITQRHQFALQELYSRYGRSLRALIGSVVREESEADDVLQESFLQIWREARN